MYPFFALTHKLSWHNCILINPQTLVQISAPTNLYNNLPWGKCVLIYTVTCRFSLIQLYRKNPDTLVYIFSLRQLDSFFTLIQLINLYTLKPGHMCLPFIPDTFLYLFIMIKRGYLFILINVSLHKYIFERHHFIYS